MSQSGEREFETALDAIYPALVRAARVLCRSDSDVEDVVQEALLAALRGRASFDGEASPFTWCYTILARTAARANRRRWQMPRLSADGQDVDWAQHVDAPLPPVDSRLLDDEASRALVDAVRALPQRQRELITLHFLQDCSYGEIAAALGISLGTVKATVFAAKRSLRKTLGPAPSELNR